ncbi:MAG: FGGY family carbohydrate kinase [Burkholderiaceae bacterium]
MKVILALDQGTTSSRAIVFDEDARILASAQRETHSSYPHDGWVEQDAIEIAESQFAVAAEAIAQAGIAAPDIAAIGINNQRETTIVWDRATGVPVGPAIVWQDRRTADFCESIRQTQSEEGIAWRTGLVVDPYFSASKLTWMLDNLPFVVERAEAGELAFGTVDSWLIWNLTAGALHVTDVSNASRTLLYNIHKLRWDDRMLSVFGVPKAMLPTVVESSKVIGATASADGAVDTAWDRVAPALRATLQSLPPDTLIAGVAGDQQAALFGQCCFEPGMVKTTYGTGCFMLMNTGHAPTNSKAKLLSTVGWRIPRARTGPYDPFDDEDDGVLPLVQVENWESSRGWVTTTEAIMLKNPPEIPPDPTVVYALEGSVFAGGAVVQWLRDQLCMIEDAAAVEALAASVPDSGGVVLVPAFAGLGAPYWDAYARGALVGITRATGKAHIARAALESIAFQVCDVLDAMESDTGIKVSELRVDGGASVNDLLMQMQADLLGVSVVRPTVIETTALGAAYLAGLAVGLWEDKDAIAGRWQVDRVFTPAMTETQREQRRAVWRRAVERARGWAT